MSPDTPTLLARIDEEPDKLHGESTPAAERASAVARWREWVRAKESS